MRRIGLTLAIIVFLVVALSDCAEKKPPGPPQELLDEVAQLNSMYASLSDLKPTEDDAVSFRSRMSKIQSYQDAGNYKQAMAETKYARLELIRLHALLVHRELMTYNPPATLTYYYRMQSKASEDAEAAGNVDQAIQSAGEALNQIQLALDLQEQCLENCQKSLVELKDQIEQLYRPLLEIVTLFWDTMDAVAKKDCTTAEENVKRLHVLVTQARNTSLSGERIFIVTSPPDFVRIYGDPIMYQEVTPKGLSGELRRVAVGQPVIFVRCLLYSRDKTYYLVEDRNTGRRGWLAEERVWPERAAQH